jgi:hypothetical protein
MSFRQGHGSGEKARCFCSAICRRWPIARFSPVSSLPLLVRADISQPIRLSSGQTRLGRPRRRGGSRSISRPSDRSTEPASGLGPFGSRSLRQKHRRGKRHACFHHANNQDWSHISPACCTVAAAPTYRWETHRADCRLRILPPRGLAAQRPVSRKHLTQMIAVLALTANSSAAARREAPLSTSAITR